MAGSATARDRFYRKIESFLGPEDAEYLMAALPPDGWDEVATKTEVRELGSGLRTEMAELGSDLRTEMAEMRSELRVEMADLRSQLKIDMAELRADMAGIRSDMVTKADLGELLRLHIDGRVGAISPGGGSSRP